MATSIKQDCITVTHKRIYVYITGKYAKRIDRIRETHRAGISSLADGTLEIKFYPWGGTKLKGLSKPSSLKEGYITISLANIGIIPTFEARNEASTYLGPDDEGMKTLKLKSSAIELELKKPINSIDEIGDDDEDEFEDDEDEDEDDTDDEIIEDEDLHDLSDKSVEKIRTIVREVIKETLPTSTKVDAAKNIRELLRLSYGISMVALQQQMKVMIHDLENT